MSDVEVIGRRPIAGIGIETSVLGLEINPVPTALLEQDKMTTAWIRRSLGWGVSTLDLGRLQSPQRVIRLVRAALAGIDARVLLIVGFSPGSAHSGPSGPTLRDVGRPASGVREEKESLLETIRSLRPAGSVLVDWDPGGELPSPTDPTAVWLDDLVREGTIIGWSLRRGFRVANLGGEPREGWKTPVSVELSLLQPAILGSLDRQFAGRPGSALVRNPFASGRLDGSRISRANDWPAPSARPVDLGALHAEFDPVLRLAPLTRNRRRTLAQASIQYLLRWPWVATVILPLTSIEHRDEIQGAFLAPELETSELERLGLLPEAAGTARVPSGPPS